MTVHLRRFEQYGWATALLACAAGAHAKTIHFPLVRDATAVASVVTVGNNDTLRAAVKDLQTYVERISGAKLDIHENGHDVPGPTLHLGETALFAETAGLRARLLVDGFVIARIGEDLLIAGNLPQGTANGITTVLQDDFGVRWYFVGPLWEIVPQRPSLTISFEPNTAGDARVVNPSFCERTLWGRPESLDFARRMRLTQKGVPLPHVGTSHDLNRVVNPEKHRDHPEYFAFYDGRRHVEPDVHPCFTHPDMFEVFMRYVRGGGRSFGVNDNHTACRCERCLAVDGKSLPYQGMWNFSESYFQLMSRVAAQTAKEFPGQRLGVFAYQLTNAPPQTVAHIGDNVDVVLCQDTSQYFDPEYRRIDQEMSAAWVRKCGHVRFYDYIGINYWMPRYFPSILADQMRHIARAGVVGYGTHATTMIDSAMPMFYLLYQLLWHADADADGILREMFTHLYGQPDGPVAEFYRHWERCWERQTKGRWFWGMDNLRGEMQIYTPEDIARGRDLLAQAAARATNDRIRQRVAFLQERFAFTDAAAQAHFASTEAIRGQPPATEADAVEQSNRVTRTWTAFADRFEKAIRLNGTSVSGWVSKTDRVRTWGLKQQMRDAALAPLVRWACANELRLDPARLRAAEQRLASVAVGNRRTIEDRVTRDVDAARREPRADGLLVADVPRAASPPALHAAADDWPGIPRVRAAPWFYRNRPENQPVGKYEEPMPQNLIDPPPPADLSITWQCAWDQDRLYVRLVVTDDRHEQAQPAAAMWKEDSVQIALNPARDNFAYDLSSWDYIWGGYRGRECEFGISLRGESTDVHVWHGPKPYEDARSLVDAKAARHGSQTVYEAAVSWRLIPGFVGEARRSLGVCIVVNDAEHGRRRSAEYGSGVAHAKRPSEFAGLRLAGE